VGVVAVGHAHTRFENGRLNDPNLEEEIREVVHLLLATAQPAEQQAAA
jgi:hypothetical protein